MNNYDIFIKICSTIFMYDLGLYNLKKKMSTLLDFGISALRHKYKAMHYVMYVLSELLIRRSRSLGDLAYEEDFSFLKHHGESSYYSQKPISTRCIKFRILWTLPFYTNTNEIGISFDFNIVKIPFYSSFYIIILPACFRFLSFTAFDMMSSNSSSEAPSRSGSLDQYIVNSNCNLKILYLDNVLINHGDTSSSGKDDHI
ncbi:hypothetical protein AGLY_001710 [Aphis glycines]|uniref:Uncharacterized protein n=1 Tax=Aphis glycines TaxID=307491 RepID=A0A6G0U4H1_APHGL|nr:hypothetical protein AGLY_001710 [Aphis glycines]